MCLAHEPSLPAKNYLLRGSNNRRIPAGDGSEEPLKKETSNRPGLSPRGLFPENKAQNPGQAGPGRVARPDAQACKKVT
ncbi:unnamed protein product [Caenorhabditis auriculariae]|uniref:Uncharacterized protein n=1 Tax=Caenorhabditis auriculariae TaxID=2777116 RepID=A0A8S1GYJ0_9PELO|nr:unnamed protein product [Caenorhabditis auriculariae]